VRIQTVAIATARGDAGVDHTLVTRLAGVDVQVVTFPGINTHIRWMPLARVPWIASCRSAFGADRFRLAYLDIAIAVAGITDALTLRRIRARCGHAAISTVCSAVLLGRRTRFAGVIALMVAANPIDAPLRRTLLPVRT